MPRTSASAAAGTTIAPRRRVLRIILAPVTCVTPKADGPESTNPWALALLWPGSGDRRLGVRSVVRLVLLLCAAAVVAAAVVAPADAARISAAPAAEPVPSLTPAATAEVWEALVSRPHSFRFATAACNPVRATFYSPADWLRLATKLAASSSACAHYYVSVPPLAADKTQLRGDQA